MIFSLRMKGKKLFPILCLQYRKNVENGRALFQNAHKCRRRGGGRPGGNFRPPVAETSEEGYQAGESDAWAGMFRCGR